jgi:lysophospholipase L1-like esterase
MMFFQKSSASNFCKENLMKKIRIGIGALLFMVALLQSASAAVISDFSDVSTGSWFYESVKFVTENGMFNGTSISTFSPGQTMTRGMFVTVLGRYGGAPSSLSEGNTGTISKDSVNVRNAPSTTGTTIIATLNKGTSLQVTATVADSSGGDYQWYEVTYNGSTAYVRSDMMTISKAGSFSDVSESMYYAPYICWACENGIASASGGYFYPDRPITREDICLMLKNYAALKHLKLDPTDTSAAAFTDIASASSANREAVTLMQQLGVVNGYGDGTFCPMGSATRAEVSTMLMRFIAAVTYIPVVESPYDQSGNYIFGRELPETSAVQSSYFDDACFIGHSIVVGMSSYFGLSNADFYAVNGASCKYLLNSYEGFTLADGSSGTLSQALSENSYGKIYIMLGTNELGSSAPTFKTNLAAVVSLVRQYQPSAKIFLYSVTPVTQACSESSASFNRDNIVAFNNAIKSLCAEQKCYFLNVFDRLIDSDGYLPEENALSDGIHLVGSQYAIMKNYTLIHTA